MRYKTLQGNSIDYDLAFIGKPIREWTLQDNALTQKYKLCFTALVYAEQHLIEKRQEVIKLQHENEFMRGLLDKYMIGE